MGPGHYYLVAIEDTIIEKGELRMIGIVDEVKRIGNFGTNVIDKPVLSRKCIACTFPNSLPLLKFSPLIYLGVVRQVEIMMDEKGTPITDENGYIVVKGYMT